MVNFYFSWLLKDEAVCSISSVGGNLKGLLEDLANPPLRGNLDPDLQRLDQSLKQLTSNIEYLAGPLVTKKKKGIILNVIILRLAVINSNSFENL